MSNHAYLLTPRGPAALAVIRLQGPAVADFLTRQFARPVVPGKPIHATLFDQHGPIDDPVIVVLPNGGADITLHGSDYIVDRVLDLARTAGFEIHDQPDRPLPLDAADGPTILHREVAAHLPRARTPLAVHMLVNQPAAWQEFIRRSAPAPAEQAHLARWTARSEALKSELRRILDDRALLHLLTPPRVAIIGAPNVGKSTLANQLFARQRVITADLPGTTRDWVGEIANIDGLPIMLVDTPGQRETTDPIEHQAILASQSQIRAADLVLIVLDAARPLEPDQAPLLEAHPDALRIINKADAPHAWDASNLNALRTVATTGQGIDPLRQLIRAHFHLPTDINEQSPRIWTDRQRGLIEHSLTNPAILQHILDDRSQE